jgi:hypothetical protein
MENSGESLEILAPEMTGYGSPNLCAPGAALTRRTYMENSGESLRIIF